MPLIFGLAAMGMQQHFSAKEAKKQRDWQERMSNTAYQRAMKDMREANLNPMLAYMKGGASTPQGAKGDVPDWSKGVASAMDEIQIGQKLKQNRATLKATNAQTNNTNAQASANMANAQTARAQASVATQRANLLRSNPGLLKAIVAGEAGDLGRGILGVTEAWDWVKNQFTDDEAAAFSNKDGDLVSIGPKGGQTRSAKAKIERELRQQRRLYEERTKRRYGPGRFDQADATSAAWRKSMLRKRRPSRRRMGYRRHFR